MTELEVTQNALDMFMSSTATETVRALKVEFELNKLRTQVKEIYDNHSQETNVYAVLDDLLELIGTFPNE